MFRRSVLICALLFSAPTLWDAFVTKSATPEDAAIRFLIAMPVAALLLAIVRSAAARRSPHADDPAPLDEADQRRW